MPAATVFDLSISEHVKRAFARDIQYFCFMETQFPIKQEKPLAVRQAVFF